MKIIRYISGFIWVIPIILYLLRRKQLDSPYFKMLFAYALVNLIAESIAKAMVIFWGAHNLIVYNILDVVSVTVYYWGVKQSNKLSVAHRVVFWVVLCLSTFTVYQSHNLINAYSNVMVYGFIGFTSLIMLVKLTAPQETFSMEMGVFWLFCGFIIYSFSELSLYFLFNYIILDTDWGIVYFRIYNLLILLITVGMFARALTWKNNN